MRLWGLAACVAVLSGCSGGTAPDGGDQARKTGELTVTVPPISPEEAATDETPAEAGFETVAATVATPQPTPVRPVPAKIAAAWEQPAAAEPAEVEVTVAPAGDPAATQAGDTAAEPAAAPAAEATPGGARPAGASAWAGYLRKAGFPCRRIASAARIERAANPGLEYYRVQCEGGGAYQATNKRGHLYFRRWRG